MPRKRSADEIQRDREAVAELMAQGFKPSEIAARLSLPQPTIRQDIQAIKDQWEQGQMHNYQYYVQSELTKLAAIESETWAAYRRSQQAITSTTTSTLTGGEGDVEPGIGVKVSQTEIQKIGDPAFLNTLLKLSNQRSNLLGLTTWAATNAASDEDSSLSLSDAQAALLLESMEKSAQVEPRLIEAEVEVMDAD